MSVDIDKNKSTILAAYEDLLSDKTNTDWILLGYEGPTNVLKLVETGDGGINEMAEDLIASKIMYPVLKVSDPKTSRNKIILINWQGEGAPNLRKGACARHVPDVKKLLKGVHITLNARNDDEVEESVIMAAVSKATATEYNFKDRSEMPEKNSPVGTNYKRTNPLTEMNSNSRNKFWEEQEAEEKRRKDEEIKKREEDAKKLEKERLEREVKEAKHREDINKDRNIRINATKKAEKAAESSLPKGSDTAQWQQEVQQHEKEEVERARRADHMRMERKKEAESLIGQKTLQTRSMFESCPAASSTTSTNKAPRKVLKQSFISNVNDSQSTSPKEESTVAPKKKVSGRWPPQQQEEETPETTPGKIADWKPKVDSPQQVKNEINIEQTSHQETKNEFHQEIQREVREEVQEQVRQEILQAPVTVPVNLSYSTSPHTPPSSPVVSPGFPVETKTNGHSEPVSPVEPEQPVSSPSSEELKKSEPNSPLYGESTGKHIICEIDGVDYQILPEHGLCARALYDYQAADETEITFDPGDIITNIDQIDVGWWQGMGPTATFGLFPANYVELITASDQ